MSRGRPEIGPVVTLRVPQDVLAEVDALAAAEGVTRAVLMRRFIEDGTRRARA